MWAVDNKSISASMEERDEEVLMRRRVRRERVVDTRSRMAVGVGSGLTLGPDDPERLIREAPLLEEEAALEWVASTMATNAGKGEELSEIPGIAVCHKGPSPSVTRRPDPVNPINPHQNSTHLNLLPPLLLHPILFNLHFPPLPRVRRTRPRTRAQPRRLRTRSTIPTSTRLGIKRRPPVHIVPILIVLHIIVLIVVVERRTEVRRVGVTGWSGEVV